jgi:hypothetical protein
MIANASQHLQRSYLASITSNGYKVASLTSKAKGFFAFINGGILCKLQPLPSLTFAIPATLYSNARQSMSLQLKRRYIPNRKAYCYSVHGRSCAHMYIIVWITRRFRI